MIKDLRLQKRVKIRKFMANNNATQRFLANINAIDIGKKLQKGDASQRLIITRGKFADQKFTAIKKGYKSKVYDQ